MAELNLKHAINLVFSVVDLKQASAYLNVLICGRVREQKAVPVWELQDVLLAIKTVIKAEGKNWAVGQPVNSDVATEMNLSCRHDQ